MNKKLIDKMMMSSLLNGSKKQKSEQTFSIASLLGKKIEAKEETKEENVTIAHGKNSGSSKNDVTQYLIFLLSPFPTSLRLLLPYYIALGS